ncbi:MAG: DNA primase [Nitrospinota bacterium]|nr:DNA primase [Nitrospinota bacterium]
MNKTIPENIIEEIRSRADIYEVVSEFVPLKKAGKNYKGLCPFHSEKTPSFNVSPEKQIYHCFGCGAGGNVFKFLMEKEDLPFVDVVKRLASRYQVTIPASSYSGQNSASSNEREALLNCNILTAKYFASQLKHPQEGKKAREYLSSRGFDDQTIEDYQLGWALPGWRDLLAHLESQTQCSRDTLAKFGLVSKKEAAETRDKKDAYYDRFRERLIFPIQDSYSNIIGFGGRVVGEGEPKYLNSPETRVYKKGLQLFGLNKAKEAIRQEEQVLIVEGYFDQIRAWVNGVKNVVATCGTALTPQQALLLKPLTQKAVLVFDSDPAGHAAAERGFEVLQEHGFSVFVAVLPEGHDPDSLIREQGKEGFIKLIQDAQPFIHYLLDRILRSAQTRTTEDKIGAINRVLPVLAKIQNSVERSEHIRYVAERVGVEDRAFLEEMRKSLTQNKNRVVAPASSKKGNHDPEWYLIQLMLADETAAKDIASQISPEEYQNPAYRETATLLYALLKDNQSLRVDRLIDRTDRPEVKSILTQVGLEPILFDNISKAVTDCINEIRRHSTQKKINELKQQRNEAERTGQLDRSRELHQQVREMQFSLLPQ